MSRRRVAGAAMALGGALLLPAGPALATTTGPGTLRRGTPHRAGLLDEHLRRMVTAAAGYLGPSPTHPYYPGAVLLAGRGRIVAVEEALGLAVRYARYDEATDTGVELPPERQIPMAPDTVFDLASLTKLFTSILAVQQIERGALRLEDPAAAHLPEFGAAGKAGITVRQLLTHTSGLRPDLRFFDLPNQEERLRLLWREAPLDPPGTVYRYSDLNLITLQLLLERITGRPLDVLLRQELTEPLGMASTRYNPPPSWRHRIAATEDQRKPWARVDRGLVWGEVHDENAWSFGGVAGHAGVFASAWDLAVLCRTLLNGGSYGRARVLSRASVELMLSDFNTAFPGDAHGLGFELHQYWYMGAMATPRTAGHTGFTGTSLVLDPTTDSFLVLLSNSVHPCRTWRSGSAPRAAAANHMARAVPVRPASGTAAWFSGMVDGSSATLTLPPLTVTGDSARLRFALWWDLEPGEDRLLLEASVDDGAWRPLPFTTRRPGGAEEAHPDGSAGGYGGRAWHRATAELTGLVGLGSSADPTGPSSPADPTGPAGRTERSGAAVRLRWRYVTGARYVGRGVYVDGIRVSEGGRALFDDSRPADASAIEARGWAPSAD
ncbi:serine hydrolase [Streptomyces sp. URMC 123]|uniref:serine hydrolase domain-containing protein n=1 Tax=Streptomyces sp. URMC 123 TaxID=3423403 RepID=UPI003F1BDD7B